MPLPLNEQPVIDPSSSCVADIDRLLPVSAWLTKGPMGGEPPLPFRPPLARSRNWKQLGADAAYVLVTVTGWLAGNILGVLGCAVAMFLVISHADLNAFFLHVDNLTSRYAAAEPERRAVFDHQVVQVFVIACAVVLVARAPRFISRLRAELAEGQGA